MAVPPAAAAKTRPERPARSSSKSSAERVGQPEILPPHRLFFPAMPINNVGQDPTGLLLLVPFSGIGRNISRQSFDQRVDLDQPVGDLLVRRAVARLRAGHVCPVSDQLRPLRFEPVAQDHRGTAIILVVGAHHGLGLFGNRRRIAELEIGLEIGERDIRIGQRRFAFEAIEGLQPLDRIAFDARAQTMAHDLIEIDEEAGAEHPVDLLLARRIAAHQALQGRRLVRGVVVDVQAGELRPPRHHEIDEPLEGALLVGAGERPVALIDERAVCVLEQIAEQIFEAVLADERIAFEVEKHIAVGGFGQAGEPEAGLHRQQLEFASACRAGLDHDPRLLADADIGIGRTAIGLPVERQRHAGQALHRRDAARLQLIDLNLRDAGNEAEMIVIAATLVASLSPAADIAMLDRIGVGVICRRRGHGRQQRALHLPEIRRIVGEAILLRLKSDHGATTYMYSGGRPCMAASRSA